MQIPESEWEDALILSVDEQDELEEFRPLWDTDEMAEWFNSVISGSTTNRL